MLNRNDNSRSLIFGVHKSYVSFQVFLDTHNPFTTTSEDLLDYITKTQASYQDYLDLRKLTMKQGYKTAFDLPLSEDEFKYRGLLKQFAQWNADNHVTCVDANSLLNWLFTHYSGEALVYDEYLSLIQAGARQGLVTAIDMPISEAEYNKKYLNSEKSPLEQTRQANIALQLWAEKVERGYYDITMHPNENRISLVQLIKRVANEVSRQSLSGNQVNDIKEGLVVFCKRSIEDDYYFLRPRSFLSDLVSSIIKSDNNEENDMRYLVSLRNVIKHAPDDFTKGLIWKSNEDLLSRIDSMLKRLIALHREQVVPLRLGHFSGLSFFQKRDSDNCFANKMDESKNEDISYRKSIR